MNINSLKNSQTESVQSSKNTPKAEENQLTDSKEGKLSGKTNRSPFAVILENKTIQNQETQIIEDDYLTDLKQTLSIENDENLSDQTAVGNTIPLNSVAQPKIPNAEILKNTKRVLAQELIETISTIQTNKNHLGQSEVSIKMKSDILEGLEVKITMDSTNQVTLKFIAETSQVSGKIQQQLPELKSTLLLQNISLQTIFIATQSGNENSSSNSSAQEFNHKKTKKIIRIEESSENDSTSFSNPTNYFS